VERWKCVGEKTKSCNKTNPCSHSTTGSFILGGTSWGSWGGYQYCPYPYTVNGVNLRIESKQGNGDDTALNEIRLNCGNNDEITSARMGWGYYRGWTMCPAGSRMNHAKLRYESNQGRRRKKRSPGILDWIPTPKINIPSFSSRRSTDDTAANGLRFQCASADLQIFQMSGGIQYPGDGYWGVWTEWDSCPYGSVIYGIDTMVEDCESGCDDTALNQVEFVCTKLPNYLPEY